MTQIHDTDHLDAGVPVDASPSWSSIYCGLLEDYAKLGMEDALDWCASTDAYQEPIYERYPA